MRKSIILYVALACAAGIVVVATAQPLVNRSEPSRSTGIEKVAAQRIADYVQSVAELSWSIDADGTVRLAGLTHFEIDGRGRAIVEARPTGDFLVDPSLSIHLPVVQGPDGASAVIGLESATVRGENVVLTIDLGASLPGSVDAGRTAGQTCSMFKPINCNPVYCSGTCNLGFNCTWKVVGQDLICDCVSPE